MKNMILLSIILMASLSLATPSQASIVYDFTNASGVEQSTYVIDDIGGTVDVNVWLKQTDADTVLTDEGLTFAGVKLSYAVSGIVGVLSITPNPAFDDLTALLIDIGSDYCTLDMAVSDIFTNTLFPDLSTPDRIWLGTFSFQCLSAGSVQITAMDNSEVDNTLTGLGNVLDSDIGTDQITVSKESINTIPEPSGFVVFSGLFLMAGLFLRFKNSLS